MEIQTSAITITPLIKKFGKVKSLRQFLMFQSPQANAVNNPEFFAARREIEDYSELERLAIHTIIAIEPKGLDDESLLWGMMHFVLLQAKMKQEGVVISDLNKVVSGSIKNFLNQPEVFIRSEWLCEILAVFKLYGININHNYSPNLETPPWVFEYPAVQSSLDLLMEEFETLFDDSAFPSQITPAIRKIYKQGISKTPHILMF